MRFRGRLGAPGDSGGGVAALVAVEGGLLTLSAGDQPLGHWPLIEVTVERVGGSRFALHVQNEKLVFVADDPLAFSYEGIPVIEEAKRPVRTRWWQAPKPPKPGPEQPKPRPALSVVRPQPIERAAAVEGQPNTSAGAPAVQPTATTTAAVQPTATAATRLETPHPESASPELQPMRVISPSHGPSGCRGRRRDGEACRATIVGSSGYCYLHDPATATRRAQVPRPVRRRRPGNLNRLYQRLEAALDELSSGELAPERAGALAALVGAMCDLLGIDSEPLGFAVTKPPPQQVMRTARQING